MNAFASLRCRRRTRCVAALCCGRRRALRCAPRRRSAMTDRAGDQPGRHRSLAGARRRRAADRHRIRLRRRRRPGPAGQGRRRATWPPACSTRAPASSTPRPFTSGSNAARSSSASAPSRDSFRGSLRTLKEQPRRGLRRLAAGAERAALRRRQRSSACARRSCRGCAATARTRTTSRSRTWWATAFPDHPYGQPIDGTVETVPASTADDLKRLHPARAGARQSEDRRSSATSIAETVGKLLDSTFGALPAKAELTPVAEVGAAGRSDAASSSSSTCRRP